VGRSLGAALTASTSATGYSRHTPRAAMVGLLWHQAWEIDLEEPLSSATRIDRVREMS
jgi:hypothetical protein